MDLTLLINYVPLILIMGGVTAISWLLERFLRPVPVVGEPLSLLMKVILLFEFFVGVLLIVTAAVAWATEATHVDSGTRYLLIVTGIALFLKPIKDTPWAALVGLAAGGFCAGFVYLFYPLPESVYGVSSTWIYLFVFFIPALVVYLLFKFIEDVLRLIGTILGFKPVSLALGLLCITQGILMLLERSLFPILLL